MQAKPRNCLQDNQDSLCSIWKVIWNDIKLACKGQFSTMATIVLIWNKVEEFQMHPTSRQIPVKLPTAFQLYFSTLVMAVILTSFEMVSAEINSLCHHAQLFRPENKKIHHSSISTQNGHFTRIKRQVRSMFRVLRWGPTDTNPASAAATSARF